MQISLNSSVIAMETLLDSYLRNWLVGPCCSFFYSFFVLSYYVSLRSGFRVVMSVTISV